MCKVWKLTEERILEILADAERSMPEPFIVIKSPMDFDLSEAVISDLHDGDRYGTHGSEWNVCINPDELIRVSAHTAGLLKEKYELVEMISLGQGGYIYEKAGFPFREEHRGHFARKEGGKVVHKRRPTGLTYKRRAY